MDWASVLQRRAKPTRVMRIKQHGGVVRVRKWQPDIMPKEREDTSWAQEPLGHIGECLEALHRRGFVVAALVGYRAILQLVPTAARSKYVQRLLAIGTELGPSWSSTGTIFASPGSALELIAEVAGTEGYLLLEWHLMECLRVLCNTKAMTRDYEADR